MASWLRIALVLWFFVSTGSARGDADSNASPGDGKPHPVNFAREIRPILSDNCFTCHGPDDQKRKASLRLDTREGAFGRLKGGDLAINPGKPDESDLIFRIESDDPDLRMPPQKSGKQLTAAQIAVLRRWIEQGATSSTHWAFEPPRKPALPQVKNLGWPVTEIDRLILARLEAEGLSPAPQAGKSTLIRRVTLDLTGLPPTPTEVDAFLSDPSESAYERVIDRLLESPRYGEHMARFWLDAARYGDTHGLHLDNYREIWLYRDWVIRAFNSNKPFDNFIVEQLAGDLLPNPSSDQLIATGYNRCHVSTNEGGSIEEEVYVRNIVDQVDTNGTVFLGLTTGCARCHDHKYDPIRTKDYYQLFAFFNNIDGPPMDGNAARWAPIMQVPVPRQAEALRAADAQIAGLKQKIAAASAQAASAYDFVEHAYATTSELVEPLRSKLEQAQRTRKQLDEQIPTTLVFREKAGEPKPAFLLKRGEYDQKGEKVGRAVPAFLPPLPPGAPVNRLGFAQWLVAPNHPLTARVAVNRFWLQVFGTGLVKTAEDFGAQGEPPSHPELLDWLAVQFREDGWDVKRFMKRLVMSATYRQSSRLTPEALTKDPANRLLARGPRFRLDAEMLRDQAFFASGILVETVGGPSVKPPQPSGLWEAVGYTDSNTAHFAADTGVEKIHRRSLYTFWKRTSPPPQMTTFDAPSREACQVRRERTNTPLQALLLMNEPQFIEAARTLAERTLREGGRASDDRLAYMFRLVNSRSPDTKDLAELSSALKDLTAHYTKQPEAARRLIAAGETNPDPRYNPTELAAWTMIGNVILNLDEAITKG